MQADPVNPSAVLRGLAIGSIPILLLAASAGFSAYHGYKRNNSAGWGAVWGLSGLLFPVITPIVAVAQGYGKKKRK